MHRLGSTMTRLGGYSLGTRLSSGGVAEVYEARDASGEPVLLRVYPAALAARAQRSFELFSQLAGPGVARVRVLEREADRRALVLERPPGVPLAELLESGELTTEQKSCLALNLTRAVARVHAAGLLLGDWVPSEIWVDLDRLAVQLLSFDRAQRLGEAAPAGVPLTAEQLAHASPEATGHLGGSCDARSDLYALGVILYRLWIGRLPFRGEGEGGSPLGAKLAGPDGALQAELSLPVATLVSRMLEPHPESRPPSARAVAAVLEEPDSAPGCAARIWPLPQAALRGERSLAVLAGAHAEAEQGRCGLVVIAGPPGSGRRGLVDGLAARAAAVGGYLLRARCDRERRHLPYGALRDAFACFVRQVQSEGAAAVETWQTALADELGEQAGVLVDALPELRPLVPDAPEPLEVPARAALKRLHSSARRLLRLLASPGRPLILFFADAPAIDSASEDLIRSLLERRDPAGLLVLASCPLRADADAVHSSDAASEAVAELPARWAERIALGSIRAETIELAPLPAETLQAALEGAGCSPAAAQELEAWLSRGPGRDPLRLSQLFAGLEPRGPLVRGPAGEWSLASGPLSRCPSPEADTLIADRLERSPYRALLGRLAWLREPFTADALSPGDSGAGPWLELLESGWLAAEPAGLRFAHPELRRVAREAGDRSARSLAVVPAAAGPDDVFDAAERARAAEAPESERVPLHLAAARRALVLGATDLALDQLAALRACSDALEAEARFELELLCADAAWLRRRPSEAAKHLDAAQALASGPAQSGRVATRRIPLAGQQDGADRGAEVGLQALHELAVPLRTRIRGTALRRRLVRIERALGRADVPSAAALDPRARAALDVIVELLEWTDRKSSDLASWLACEGLEIALRHGEGQPGQGALLTAWYAQAAQRAGLAESAWSRCPFEPAPSSALENARQLLLSLRLDSWRGHRRKLLSPLRAIVESTYRRGEIDLNWEALFWRGYLMVLVGLRLDGGENALASAGSRHRGIEERHALGVACAAACARLSGSNHADVSARDTLREPASRVLCGTLEMLVDGVLGDYSMVLERAEELEDAETVAAGWPHLSEFHLMRGLATAAQLDQLSGRERRRLRAIAARSADWLHERSRISPENFEHQSLMIRAELERADGHLDEALALYGAAGHRAEVEAYVHHAAMIRERRARLCFELGLESEAMHFLRAAAAGYEAWGARLKAEQLESEHSVIADAAIKLRAGHTSAAPLADADLHRLSTQMMTTMAGTTMSTSTSTSTSTASANGASSTGSGGVQAAAAKRMGLETVLRASESISQEIELPLVIEHVLRVAIESSGAQRAVLLLEHESGLRIEGQRALEEDQLVPVQLPIALASTRDVVPRTLVEYVERTRNTVVLDHASLEGLFTEDPYVVQHASKSLLCLPIVRQSKLVGMLYLEQPALTDVFDEERVEVLGLLSSHAAISLDNARLYAELKGVNRALEQRVEERTRQLREARDAAEAATRAKSEFLAVMSHEIRTPMNVVIGMAQLLLEGKLSIDQLECTRSVHTAGEALLTIINDILDFSKIEAGKLELESTDFSLRQIVDEALQVIGPRAQKKSLELYVALERGLSDTWVGDPSRLRQVIVNLLANAVKFTERGEVEVRVRAAGSGSSGEDGQPLRIEVRDTGIGIAPEGISQLFQSFSQINASNARRYGGTGLGLAICKRLVEAMSGVIGVESEPGAGSTFWFEIPLGASDAASRWPPLSDVESLEVVVVGEGAPARVREHAVEQFEFLGAHTRECGSLHELAALPAPEDPRRRLVAFCDPSALSPEARALFEGDDAPGLLVLGGERAEALGAVRGARMLSRPPTLAALQDALRDRLRIAAGGSVEVPVSPGESQPELSPDRGPFHILLAEDYELNQRLATRLLERAGYVCTVAENGRIALEARIAGAYDLILMDCQMPEMDGFQATRQIREWERENGGHIPIVAMTANAMAGDRERCLEAGMDDYLSKPIRVEILHEILRKHLAAAAQG